ncbi:Rho GTPase-activating protein 24 [Liparis tanakae]|uniref:Rho GTPase-activating protein 24 n=1 Tax=Liparis tanakae TaxID=230148 RepID=A0A4Z2FI78_9TELE|nr:Rho GTPase-activating protein 24 [Liparis tanakae]
MSGQNLATVFGPNILRAKAEDPQSIMRGAALVQVLMLELIREHESLFAKVPPTTSARSPRGLHHSPSALRQPHLRPPPCLRQLSMPLIVERSREPGQNHSCAFSTAAKTDLTSGQKRFLGHRYTSSHPENCFYPSPSSSQPLQHLSERHNIDYHRHHAGQGPSSANGHASTNSLQDPMLDSCKPRSSPMSWTKAWPGPADAANDLQVTEPQSQPGGAHSLLAKLRHQMVRQKAEYQTRIQRLERCNDVLERQVAVLRTSLEQQRRSRSVAEIKIGNMERAKADADLRNDALQREMEMFFRMYGEARRRGGDSGVRGGGSL